MSQKEAIIMDANNVSKMNKFVVRAREMPFLLQISCITRNEKGGERESDKQYTPHMMIITHVKISFKRVQVLYHTFSKEIL